MDPVGVLPEGEWNPFSGMFTSEEAEFMANLLGNCPLPNEQDLGMSLGAPSNFWPGHEASTNMAMGDESSYYCSDTVNSDSFFFPQGSNYSSDTSSLFIPNSVDENYLINSNSIFLKNNSSMTMNIGIIAQKNANSSVEVFSNNLTEEALCMNEELYRKNSGDNGENPPEAVIFPNKKLQPRMKSEIPEVIADAENENTILLENPKKRSRASGDVQKNKKNVQSKKKRKLVGTNNEEEESNGDVNGQSSSSYCSEDDSNASQELNGGATSSSKGPAALNSNGKTRANRGSATDPQSLYARKRRERINERLRILQNLVPNGTKVDISTMLEEAVQYVKFLQLQIKLLSSDDLWMYSPIAYNGMNLGLDLKIAPP